MECLEGPFWKVLLGASGAEFKGLRLTAATRQGGGKDRQGRGEGLGGWGHVEAMFKAISGACGDMLGSMLRSCGHVGYVGTSWDQGGAMLKGIELC